MRIELTISAAGGSTDVAIRTPGALPLTALAGELERVAGVPVGARLWSGERPLPSDTQLGQAGLRTGCVLSVDMPDRTGLRVGVLSLHVIGGPEAGRVVPLERGRLTIGRAAGCDVVLGDDRASRRHAVLEVGSTALTLHDLSSTNGTTIDGVTVGAGGRPVRPGQLIRIGDSLLGVCGPDDAPASLAPAEDAVLVNRAPRQTAPVVDRAIALPQRAQSARPRPVQWITALVPAAAGGAIAWVTHSPQFLLFALLSPVLMVSGALGDRLHWRRSRRRAAATYRRRRAEVDDEIAQALAAETTARRTNAPDPAALWRLATAPSSRLWERRRTDADHLAVRLGSADLPSTLRVGTGSSSAPAGVVPAVPLCVDLRAGPLGLAGPPAVVAGLARWLLAQLAVLHSPADIEFVLLLSPERAPHWAWARWLPQLAARVATGPHEWPSVVADLTATLEQRRAARRLDPHGWSGPWTVLVVDDAARLTDVTGLAALLSGGTGVTAICTAVDTNALPISCAATARVRGETGTRVSLRLGCGPETGEAVIDRVSPAWAERVARALAPLVDAGADDASAVPAVCRLLDVLGPDALDPARLAERWVASSGRPDTVLGSCADGPLPVDLVADGPHALVAGTTGAGKSELLQSLVAGLAANHPPDALTFLLVDYKGGAAFAECARLPHTAGLVTDLDPHLTRRALQSLEAELRRRERLFAAAGAADLDGYRRHCDGTAIPRLVIVVDEFASLAEELPDFVRGLVGVAQRGRSLGVHLILATQRPGSAVSAEIRANTSLRIALRVTDPAESTDVIDAPDAATIERTRPGRAYLRSGSTFTCFQAAHAGGRSDASAAPAVEPLREWRRRAAPAEQSGGRTDLARLVDAVRATARATGRDAARSPWLPPLPAHLSAGELTAASGSTVAIGRVDRPAEQRQPDLTLDLAAACSVLVAGGPGSGRTSALATVALGAASALAPEQLEIYVIDSAGPLADAVRGLPHVGTATGPAETGLVLTLLRRLDAMVARRVAAGGSAAGSTGGSAAGSTGGSAVGSAAGTAAGTRAGARLLLLVDVWDSFLAGLDDAEAGRCAELLTGLLRAGSAAGLTVVVAGDRPLLSPRFAGTFGTRLLLRFADASDYGLVGVPPRALPASMPAGRGVRAADAAEFQFAHVGIDSGAAARATEEVARRWSTAAASAGAIRIRPLPERVRVAALPHDDDRLSIGVAGDAAVPLSIDLFAGAGRFLIAGPPRSGRSTALGAVLVEAVRVGIETVVAAPGRSPLASLARQHGLRVVEPSEAGTVVGAPPGDRSLLLVDDSEAFADGPAGDQLTSWLRTAQAPLAAVVSGRCDDLAITYRGIAAEVRRSHCGLLLRPGPVDGELLGVRLPRRSATGPAGRGLLIGASSWGAPFDDGEPVPVQVAQP